MKLRTKLDSGAWQRAIEKAFQKSELEKVLTVPETLNNLYGLYESPLHQAISNIIDTEKIPLRCFEQSSINVLNSTQYTVSYYADSQEYPPPELPIIPNHQRAAPSRSKGKEQFLQMPIPVTDEEKEASEHAMRKFLGMQLEALEINIENKKVTSGNSKEQKTAPQPLHNKKETPQKHIKSRYLSKLVWVIYIDLKQKEKKGTPQQVWHEMQYRNSNYEYGSIIKSIDSEKLEWQSPDSPKIIDYLRSSLKSKLCKLRARPPL